jgi:hypothetical protein
VQSDRQAFDLGRSRSSTSPSSRKSFVTAGFDGARFKDATAIVIADLFSGVHQLFALWERPPDPEGATRRGRRGSARRSR